MIAYVTLFFFFFFLSFSILPFFLFFSFCLLLLVDNLFLFILMKIEPGFENYFYLTIEINTQINRDICVCNADVRKQQGYRLKKVGVLQH